MPPPFNLLLVEDSPDDAELLALNLEQQGIAARLTRVDHQEALLRALDTASFDAVLCDFHLPGFSAHEALEQVRTRHPEVPFLIVAGSTRIETVVDLMKQGAQDFIAKDDPTRLAHALRREIKEAHQRQRLHHAERDLAESEQLFASIVAAVQDAIILMDSRGRVVQWNRAAEILFGHDADQAAGRDLRTLIAPERFHDVFREGFERFYRHGRVIEIQALHRSGREFPVELTVGSIATAHGQYTVAVVRDISARVRTRQRRESALALRQCQLELRELAQGLPPVEVLLKRALNLLSTQAWLPLGGAGALHRLEPGHGPQPALSVTTPDYRPQPLGALPEKPQLVSTGGGSRYLLPLHSAGGAREGLLELTMAIGFDRFDPDVEQALTALAATLGNLIHQAVRHEQVRKLSQAVEQSPVAILITDRRGVIEYANRRLCELSGYTISDLVGQTPSLFRSEASDPRRHDELWSTILGGREWQGNLQNRHKDGSIYWESVRIAPIFDEAREITHFLCFKEDITEARARDQQILHLATHDTLTQLPNRAQAYDRLDHALAWGRRYRCSTAVMVLDLDDFKYINDSLGYPTGDALLRAVGERLLQQLRKVDTVSRVAGDEFMIVLHDCGTREQVETHAANLVRTLAQPFDLQGQRVQVTCSIGVSLAPEDTDSQQTLVSHADMARHHAKKLGSNSYRFYTPELGAQFRRKLGVRDELKRALDNGHLVLFYQPKVDLTSGKLVGAEALVRWEHPERGLVAPGEFIPVAEETGLISDIGQWVLEEACRQNSLWRSQGLPVLPVAINVSARQLHQDNLDQRVAEVLERYRLPASMLELELTESVIMDQGSRSLSLITRLKALGVTLAADDFGTGYSSLSYLKQLPLDRLKIDRSFIRDLPGDSDDAVIASTIIEMGHNLGMMVLAEGVETREQLDFLRRHGCDEMQGFFCARPLPAGDYAPLLKKNRLLEPSDVPARARSR